MIRLALVFLLLLPATASATAVDDAVACLQTDDPVCVEGGGLSGSDEAALERAITEKDADPMFIAVLPESAREESPDGTATGVASLIHDRLGRAGTYVVVAGGYYGGGSDGLGFSARPLLGEAVEQHRADGPAAVLTDFVDRVGDAKNPASGGTATEVSPVVPLGILGVLGLGGGALFLKAKRQRRRREEEELAEVKAVAREDLLALGDDIRALDLDVEMPDVDPAGKADYNRAVELYDRANTLFDRARHPDELAPVTEALEEGRFAMTSARARLAGQLPPERRPPCFFDPRHGPSVRDVGWAPAGGQPRPVPACGADAVRIEEGLDPDVRQLNVNGQQVAYWDAPGYYGGWSGGYFGGFGGGLLGGMFLGSMLGGGFGGFGHDTYIENNYGGEGGDFGGGGGSDFGGGDF